jgi:hypothetical protein
MFKHKFLSFSLLLISNAAFSQPAPALTVSPGGLQNATQIADGCATFSWGPVDGATGYQVAVVDMLIDNSNDHQAQAGIIEPVLETTIAAPALSWTPATGQCLEQGGSYLWFVRATTEDGEEEWSEGRYFEVDYSGSVLAEAIAQEVTIQLSQPDTWRRVVQKALQAAPRVTLLQPPSAGKQAAVPQTSAGMVGEFSGDKMDSGVSTNALTLVNPTAFRISSGDGVVFDHPTWPYPGDIPVEGIGRRFMWYPGKGALRAGYDDSSRWNDVNIGTYSVAMGDGPVASGSSSTALGSHTVASGHESTAMGSASIASGEKSTAMGAARTIASGRYSTAMGFGTTAKSGYETAIGSYNTEYTPLTTTHWRATDRLFVIGNSPDNSARSDAMVVLKNGNIGVGTSTPGVPLQVEGGSDCEPGFGGYINTNIAASTKGICIDDNEIMARNNGTTSTLYLNNNGGQTTIGGDLWIGGTTQLVLDTAGATDVCRNGSGKLSFCSSSGRYKEQVAPLPLGLDIVQQLEPVTFKWRDQEGRDLGFVAEAVAGIDPLLATYNAEGQIEGVKYKQLTAVLVKAIQEQQTEIIAQRQDIDELRQELKKYSALSDEIAAMKTLLRVNQGQRVARISN